jgi:hypothetical protein
MEHGEFKESKKILTDANKRHYSEIVDPVMVLNDPALAKKFLPLAKLLARRWNCSFLKIAHQVQWNLGGGATHQLKGISDITASLCTLIAGILGEQKLAGGYTAKDIFVTEVLVLMCECTWQL